MRGLLGLLCAVMVATIGCQSSSPATDPFLRSRIPPPGTGQVGPIPTGTYGSPPPPPPAAGGVYAPPGGNFGYSGGNVTPVTPPPNGPPAASLPAAPTYSAPPPAYGAPPPAPFSAPPPGSAPQYAPPAGWVPTSAIGAPPTTSMHSPEAVERELRPLAESARAGRLTEAAGDGPLDNGAAPGVQRLDGPQDLKDSPLTQSLPNSRVAQAIEPVSYNAPQSGAPQRPRNSYAPTGGAADNGSRAGAAAQPAGRTQAITTGTGPADRGATYGYDGNYAWLQGQLEYSQVTKQWKLRYIPIDGPTDRYGGSVVLSATSALNGYQAGNFVSVKGQLDASRTTAQGTFSPLYLVSSVDRLSD